MNAVEIEDELLKLVAEPFDAANFPYKFLLAFGQKDTTIRKLKGGTSNATDIAGAVLLKSHIHLSVAETGGVSSKLRELKVSPKTTSAKAKFVLATDGDMVEVEDLATGFAIACPFQDLAAKCFGMLLPLAGITTVREIQNNPIDIRATGRLNKLYLELLRENPEWEKEERRHDLNQFMARLIFCFFAEDTGIFRSSGLFTQTVDQMGNATNTHEVIAEVFRAMDIKPEERQAKNVRPYADVFPYVNGGLFTGTRDVPRFTKMARAYLLQAGNLDWKLINPDIFGSMIQAVADDEERGELGMHYTSVPNILKVLNPLFLDDLRDELKNAGDNARKLQNLRRRISLIRVFDPACGSGNFLVIAYKQMREIEAEVNKRLRDEARDSEIPLTNFRGIEIRDFACEIARLALIIAEYQCDVLYRGEKLALAEFLPLNRMNWITCENALRLDWVSVCEPQKSVVKYSAEDLFHTPLDQAQIDFESTGGETYICGNPPYVGDKFQTDDQKSDLRFVARNRKSSKAVDYIAGWFWKASDYLENGGSAFAFVSTNSVCQGVQVPIIWPYILNRKQEIFFAHTSFYWANNATHNANVICVIVGVTSAPKGEKYIFSADLRKVAKNINAYLVDGPHIIVEKHSKAISELPEMVAGNIPRDEGHFMISSDEALALKGAYPEASRLVRKLVGSFEFLNGVERYCLWISDSDAQLAMAIPEVRHRLQHIRLYREAGSERGKLGVDTPHRFERTIVGSHSQIVVPRVSSEHRTYLPVGFMKSSTIVSDAAQAIYDAPLYLISIISSRIHIAWIGVTAGRMKSDFRYSSGVCYNSFPLPRLTEKNKADLTRCAEDILLAREAHWPATIADLYDPDEMPEDLRAAHDRNDEVLERIYIGRRFRNDTERLEKLFEMYIKMTGTSSSPPNPRAKKAKSAA